MLDGPVGETLSQRLGGVGIQLVAWMYNGIRHIIVCSELDCTTMETQLDFERADRDPPPRRDHAVKDGDPVRLGDASLQVPMCRWYST